MLFRLYDWSSVDKQLGREPVNDSLSNGILRFYLLATEATELMQPVGPTDATHLFGQSNWTLGCPLKNIHDLEVQINTNLC